MEKLIHVNSTSESYKTLKRKLDGKTYIVVPVTMMVEGIHDGNHGPIYHPINELGKVPEAWNGIPIVINHPQKDGTAISANSPEVLEESSIGRVFATFVDETKLKAQAWLDELKLQEISVDLYNKIVAGDPIEVSVGVFTDNEETNGEWNGKTYFSIAKNHRPDHLAILPETIGACSLTDGCGLGVNADTYEGLRKLIGVVRKAGYSISQIGTNADTGYKEKIDAMYGVLRAMESKNSYCYLEEMYDDSIIYSKSSDDGTKMYKQAYKFESGKIELVGEPVEVRRKVEYVVNLSRNKSKNGGAIMANECAACKKKIDALIINSVGRWTEEDREFLLTLDEAKLDKLVPQVIEKEKEVQVNVLSKEDQDALTAYKAEKKALRDQMILDIQANSSKEGWPDDVLNVMNDDTLKRVFSSVKKEGSTDFSLNAGGGKLQSNEVEPMLPTGVEVETAKI